VCSGSAQVHIQFNYIFDRTYNCITSKGRGDNTVINNIAKDNRVALKGVSICSAGLPIIPEEDSFD